MGWFTDVMQALDKPSNAVQGLFVGASREDETAMEGLKRGWNQEENYDFEQILDEDLAKKGYYERGGADRLKYMAFGAANLIVDPLNLVGAGLFTKGVKGAEKAVKSGADVQEGAMKGFALSSIPNYIPEFYGVSKTTQATVGDMKRGLFFKSINDATPFQKKYLANVNEGLKKPVSVASYEVAKKGAGIGQTILEGGKNMAKNFANPENRAIYRSEGINKGLMTSKALSEKGDTNIEYIHRALYNMHITQQTGSTGSRQLLSDFMSRLGNEGYVPLKPGAYTDAVEGFHTVMKGADGPATKSETDAIQAIVGEQWRAGKTMFQKLTGKEGTSIGSSENALLFTKADDSRKGGTHMNDMRRLLGRKDGEMAIIQKAFDNPAVSKMNLDELADYLRGLEYTRPKNPGKRFWTKEFWDTLANAPREKYTPNFKVDEDSGNVWVNFSFKGSSITEGGVNSLVGFQPSGRMVSVVSDEHNFIEKVPGVSKMLPNRVVMMTVPNIDNIKTWSAVSSKRGKGTIDKSGNINTLKGKMYQEAKKEKVSAINKANPLFETGSSDYQQMLDKVINYKPKASNLAYEKARQKQAYGLGLMAMPTGTND